MPWSNKIDSYLDIYNKAQYHTGLSLPNAEQMLSHFNCEQLHPAHHLFYILDFTQAIYLSAGPPGAKTFLGYTTDYLKDAGPFAWLDRWHSDDFKTMNERIIPFCIGFLQELPSEKMEQLVFTTNYRLRKKDGDYIMIGQKTSYIMDQNKKITGAVGTVQDISLFKQGISMVNAIEMVDNCEEVTAMQLLHHTFYFPDEKDALLTGREKDLLKLICEGFTSQEIAQKCHLSIHTVNNHRKNILYKIQAKNVNEMIVYAIQNHIV